MKVLYPTVTIILTSHLKAPYLPESIDSVLAQTRRDFQLIVADTGEWIGQTDPTSQQMAQHYATYSHHPLIDWVTTGQPQNFAAMACPYAYSMNEVVRAGLVRGRYVCLFTDDDLYRPTFVEKMAGFLDEHPQHRAVWCSQDRVRVHHDGRSEPAEPTILAAGPKQGAQFDGVVDGLQVMFHRSLLDEIDPPWLPEDPADHTCRHADGIFLDKIGALVGVVPNVPDILITHRYTPISIFSPNRA